MGLEAFVSIFKHDGQVLCLPFDVSSSLKLIVMRFCMVIGWGLSDADAGHVGTVLSFFATGGSLLDWASGVSDGVQNDGRCGFAACTIGSQVNTEYYTAVGLRFLPFPLPALSWL